LIEVWLESSPATISKVLFRKPQANNRSVLNSQQKIENSSLVAPVNGPQPGHQWIDAGHDIGFGDGISTTAAHFAMFMLAII
jgi:hypothetical protein